MFIQFKNSNFYIVFILDLFLFSAALFGAYLIRFEFSLSSAQLDQIFLLLPFVLGLKSVIFFIFGLYKGMFRYAGLSDMWNLGKATTFSTMCIFLSMIVWNHFYGFSRAVFLIDGGLTFLFAGSLRLAIRYIFKKFLSQNGKRTKLGFFKKNETNRLFPDENGDGCFGRVGTVRGFLFCAFITMGRWNHNARF